MLQYSLIWPNCMPINLFVIQKNTMKPNMALVTLSLHLTMPNLSDIAEWSRAAS